MVSKLILKTTTFEPVLLLVMGMLLLFAALPLPGQTLIHYTLNTNDEPLIAEGTVPNAGKLGDGTVYNGLVVTNDIPTDGVPPGAGALSMFFNGGTGILEPGTRQLNNAAIFNAGGFTYETWFKWNGQGGSGDINSIIDYAGTQKLIRAATATGPQMEYYDTNNSGVYNLIGTAASNQWHYVAVVFTATSLVNQTNVAGTFSFYLDNNVNPVTGPGVTISAFGDSLNRTIAVGMHPTALAGNFFNGFIYEPRVTLGALSGYGLLYDSDIVTTNADSGPGSLRAAVANATNGAVITFASVLSGQTIMLTNGQIELSNNITIDSSGLPGGIQINGNDSSRIFQVDANVNVELNSLTLTNGTAAGTNGTMFSNAGNGQGGAIYNSGTLIMNNCTLANNISGGGSGSFMAAGGSGAGGGIYNAGTLTANNCTLANNSSTGGPNANYLSGGNGEGGAIYNSGTATVTNSTLANNNSTGGESIAGAGAGYGGGIYNWGTLTIKNSALANNSSAGGVDTSGSFSGYGGSGYGGGIYNSGTLTANNSTLASNNASGQNGAVADNGGNGEGGGVYNLGTLALNNCTLVNNSGIYGSGGFSANNGNGVGGGIYNLLTLNLTNSIVCSNTAPSNPNIFGSYPVASNLVDTNARLAPPGNYGGPTQTMPPLAGSPAIDAGDDSVTNFLATDQRGYPRLSGLHVDIGAVEAQVASTNNPPKLIDVVWSTGGGGNGASFQFAFTNTPIADFSVLTSTNLALAPSNWTVLAEVIENSPGQFQFADNTVTNAPSRFYRVVSP